MGGPWGREVGADRDREGFFPSWNSVSSTAPELLQGPVARENSLGLVFLRCPRWFWCFLRCHVVWGVAGQAGSSGCGQGPVGVTWGGLGDLLR